MLTDNQIIQSILLGDKEAYRQLVDRHRDMAYTVALKLMKDEDSAEEIAQEAFIKAYQKLSSFKGNSSFSTWLYTIVYRTAIYHLRQAKPHHSIDHQVMEMKSNKLSASDTLVKAEEKEIVRRAVDQLPKLESLIISLFYMDDKDVAEIATITNLSKANVKVKLFRARKKLKKILAPIL